MSNPVSFPNPDELTLSHVESLANVQSLNIADPDLVMVHQQFKLIASHARMVMAFDLCEEIEPAGEFRP